MSPVDVNAAAGLPARLAAHTDAAVRDLAWLLFSAGLLRAQLPSAPLAQPFLHTDDASNALDWLDALDREPTPLHDALAAQAPTRLGRYAETLLGWFLAHGPAARLVAQNVALRGEGRTLGECDFLLEADGEKLHWELAVKCYLHAGGSALADYVGPNLRDRFDWKLTHLRDRQLRLSERPELAALGFAGPWRAQMFVKGWLFYRATQAADTAEPGAPELAADHLRGWWVTRSGWAAFARAHAADGWSVLPRLAWLAPRRLGCRADATNGEDLRAATSRPEGGAAEHSGGTKEEGAARSSSAWKARSAVAGPVDAGTLIDAIAASARPDEPTLVAAFVADGAGGYRERSRGFIVPDDWPGQAAAFARE
ncbi:DUF1853 family protein [Paraburkholderia acidisoli]|uniref:DUF1853 family protein n=1 Tax=Paraburkholderia acidisoli TaxID=2571748 RepID=A0A7Z2GJD7_9BURK|nr:DUF1853 family protein [Paraburkholderia acidisoli]QGZ62892.1 DUF1853 family protein [Paraburkholderia acidisoli]